MTYPVVVLAGGLGTRVAHLAPDGLPKALFPIDGVPFIDFKLVGLAEQGATEVVLLLGHGAAQIENHVGDGRRFGLRIRHVEDGPRLRGTGGSIARILNQLPNAFWVTYGDTLLEVPVSDVQRSFLRSGLKACMTVLENEDRWETSNVALQGHCVAVYDPDPTPGKYRYIDYGMLLFRREAFDGFDHEEAFGLSEVIQRLTAERALGWFEVTERFHDIGNERAYRETAAYLRNLSSDTASEERTTS
jgi:NDP-sugar pyrophosphorylase family protein